MLATKVLASGITHLTDARYFAAWEVDFLCFPIGEQGISLEYFVAMREWVEGPVCAVELGGDAGAVSVTELTQQGITTVYLDHGIDTGDLLASGIEVITRVPVMGFLSAEDVKDMLEEIHGPAVLDFTNGGIAWSDLEAGIPFTTDALNEMLAGREVFVRIDLGDETPGEFGLAVRGSSEEKVGYKSFDDLDDLFEALEVFE